MEAAEHLSEETSDWQHMHPYLRHNAPPHTGANGLHGTDVSHVANATAAFIAGSMFLPAEDASDMHQAVMQVWTCCMYVCMYVC